MKFGPIAIADAAGAILAHTVMLAGGALKKGRTLSTADVALLADAGIAQVIGARLEPGDVAEDAAAARVARQLAGSGVRVAAPFTGRANLYATVDGLVRFETAAVAAINGIDESLTVATLAAFERVKAGQMLATVKIIPFAASEASVVAAEHAAARACLAVSAFTPKPIGLVLTELPGTKPGSLDKRTRAITDRVTRLGSRLAQVRTVAHTESAVAAALLDLQAHGCHPLLVFSASAIVDRADIVPGGVIAAGGTIGRLGMPVDPGNLLLLGALQAVPVIGIPSCAASPKLNGFDWVLERLLADVPVSSEAIAAMGVGGLLKEIASRPQPRGSDLPTPATERFAPRIACLVLAGGRSTRMGSNKLLEALAGKAIVRHVVEAALASSAVSVTVVTGNAAETIAAAIGDLPLSFQHNPDFADGLSASLKVGLRALPETVDGVIVALGDMPEITTHDFNRLIAAFAPTDSRSIVVPTRRGKRGNPVLWGRAYFADMALVSGDTGAKHLLGLHADQIAEVDLGTDAILTDIDTPDALAALRARHPEA
jgi:molybdenum cofactor cytidylyltransferase